MSAEKESNDTRNCCLLFLVIIIGLGIYFVKCMETAVEDAENAPPKTEEEIRIEMIESQFSGWNGSHIALVRQVKSTMHDPSSFKHYETRYRDSGNRLVVYMEYGGKNMFGAMVRNQIKQEYSLASLPELIKERLAQNPPLQPKVNPPKEEKNEPKEEKNELGLEFEQIGYSFRRNNDRYFTFHIKSPRKLANEDMSKFLEIVKEHGSKRRHTKGASTASFYYMKRENTPDITKMWASRATKKAHENKPIASVWINKEGECTLIKNPR